MRVSPRDQVQFVGWILARVQVSAAPIELSRDRRRLVPTDIPPIVIHRGRRYDRFRIRRRRVFKLGFRSNPSAHLENVQNAAASERANRIVIQKYFARRRRNRTKLSYPRSRIPSPRSDAAELMGSRIIFAPSRTYVSVDRRRYTGQKTRRKSRS